MITQSPKTVKNPYSKPATCNPSFHCAILEGVARSEKESVGTTVTTLDIRSGREATARRRRRQWSEPERGRNGKKIYESSQPSCGVWSVEARPRCLPTRLSLSATTALNRGLRG